MDDERLALARLRLQQKKAAAEAFLAQNTIAGLFRDRVAAAPQATACLERERSWTYAELNAKAEAIAARIAAVAPGGERRVAIFAERSAAYLAGMLAIWKLGHAFVPLDPRYPQHYLELIVRDADPHLVLADTALLAQAGRFGPDRVLGLDETGAAAGADTLVEMPPDALACIAYTSGSTGQPKAAMIPQKQVLNLLRSFWELIPFEPGDVVAQKTSPAFAVSVKEFLSGLLAGVPLVILDEVTTRDPAAFLEALETAGVTRLFIVPSHLRSLLPLVAQGSASLPRLKQVITAGEPLSAGLLAEAAQVLPAVRIWNNYGSTELNDTTYWAASAQDAGAAFVPIGREIPLTQAYVLDAQQQRAPAGVAGELYVHSAGMSLGYWRNPALTAQRFIPNPWATRPGERLYRTGDMVRRRENGALEFMGRKDFEVKIRGQRVDIQQVEAVLAMHADIAQAVVTAWNRGPDDTQLVAYLVGKEGVQPGDAMGAALKEFLGARLPSFMVPAFYIPLEQLPKLPNGKLNRLGLPSPSRAAVAKKAYREPVGELEAQLALACSELLKVPRVGRDDNFFDLGGDSLLGAQLIGRMHKQLGVQLPLTDLFGAATLMDLACAVEQQLAVGGTTDYEPIRLADAQD
ncbi:MAG: non-ribosomal peptide synthetase [Pseudomonadota bacterium]